MVNLEKILERVRLPSCLLGAGLSLLLGCVGTEKGNGYGGKDSGAWAGGSLVDPAFTEGRLPDNFKEEMRTGVIYEPVLPKKIAELTEGNSSMYLGSKKELEEFIKTQGWPKLKYKIQLEKAEALLKPAEWCSRSEALFLKAYAKQQLGLHEEAIVCYTNYIADHGKNDAAAFYNCGLARHALGKLEDALLTYESSISLENNEVTRVMLLKCMYELYSKTIPSEEIFKFLDAVEKRDLETITEYHNNQKPEDFSKLVKLCVHYHYDLKIGIAAIWMNAKGEVISHGLTYDAPKEHIPPLIVTLEHFAETLGIEKTVNYLTGFYGKKTTLDQMNTFVRTHSAATFVYGLSEYFFLLSKEETAKLDKGKTLTLQESPPHYRNLQILARDIPPEEK